MVLQLNVNNKIKQELLRPLTDSIRQSSIRVCRATPLKQNDTKSQSAFKFPKMQWHQNH